MYVVTGSKAWSYYPCPADHRPWAHNHQDTPLPKPRCQRDHGDFQHLILCAPVLLQYPLGTGEGNIHGIQGSALGCLSLSIGNMSLVCSRQQTEALLAEVLDGVASSGHSYSFCLTLYQILCDDLDLLCL